MSAPALAWAARCQSKEPIRPSSPLRAPGLAALPAAFLVAAVGPLSGSFVEDPASSCSRSNVLVGRSAGPALFPFWEHAKV